MSEQKSYTEKEVLALLAKGDRYAFAHLFNQYQARIYSTAIKMLKSPELAEEAVQDTFMRLWENREELMHVLRFEGYLITMARNCIVDVIRGISREATAVKQYARELTPETQEDPDNFQVHLQKAIDKLPPQQQQVFRLAKLDGLSYEVIAKQLKVSKFTVKNHMAVALRTLRLELRNVPGASVWMVILLETLA